MQTPPARSRGRSHALVHLLRVLGLFIATAILETNHQLPGSWQFLHGDTYKAYSAGADFAGVVFLVGIVWAAVRRYVQRPYRIRIRRSPKTS